MLEPISRLHLMEALRPPDGYSLNCAIGTTFSLDLLALLTVPLAFTMFDWQNEDGSPTSDPLALLESLRRHADHIHVFCQAGRIALPPKSQLLYTYLEQSIFQVTAPNKEGVFHPKIWVMRFTAPNDEVHYRLLCASRNLTFDHSWDTLLVLDGDLDANRQKSYSASRPLSDFLASLPELAQQPLPDQAQANIKLICDEVRRVDFVVPDEFDTYKFLPLGTEGYRRWPFNIRIDHLLVISPFISPDCLQRLVKQKRGDGEYTLVSRLESLQISTKKDLSGFDQVYVLNPFSEMEEEGEANVSEIAEDEYSVLNGLHAKLYVADQGYRATVWTGSANATGAAFEKNVEFLVALEGPKSSCGVAKFLGQDASDTGLLSLLQPYKLQKPQTPNAEQRELERLLDSVRRSLSEALIEADISPLDNTSTYDVQLRKSKKSLVIPKGVSVKCWPITLKPEQATNISPRDDILANFKGLSFEALTAFFAFEISKPNKIMSLSLRFVLNVVLHGAPEDRQERLLRSLLQDRSRLMRLLFYILLEGDNDPADFVNKFNGDENGNTGNRSTAEMSSNTLFESLVVALRRNPEKIDQIARLIEDLRKSPESQDLVSEDFDAIWKPIWLARQQLRVP